MSRWKAYADFTKVKIEEGRVEDVLAARKGAEKLPPTHPLCDKSQLINSK